jgi:hypothetical protein
MSINSLDGILSVITLKEMSRPTTNPVINNR